MTHPQGPAGPGPGGTTGPGRVVTAAALLARAVAQIVTGLALVAAGLTAPPVPPAPASDSSPGMEWRRATDAESQEWRKQRLFDLIDAKRSMR